MVFACSCDRTYIFSGLFDRYNFYLLGQFLWLFLRLFDESALELPNPSTSKKNYRAICLYLIKMRASRGIYLFFFLVKSKIELNSMGILFFSLFMLLKCLWYPKEVYSLACSTFSFTNWSLEVTIFYFFQKLLWFLVGWPLFFFFFNGR